MMTLINANTLEPLWFPTLTTVLSVQEVRSCFRLVARSIIESELSGNQRVLHPLSRHGSSFSLGV